MQDPQLTDAELGAEVRDLADYFRSLGSNSSANALACHLLINLCLETNADTLTMALKNVTRDGRPVGSWKLVLTRECDEVAP